MHLAGLAVYPPGTSALAEQVELPDVCIIQPSPGKVNLCSVSPSPHASLGGHSFVAYPLENRCDVHTVQELLGYKNVKPTW